MPVIERTGQPDAALHDLRQKAQEQRVYAATLVYYIEALEAEAAQLRKELRWAENALGIDTLGGLPTWGDVRMVGRRLREVLGPDAS